MESLGIETQASLEQAVAGAEQSVRNLCQAISKLDQIAKLEQQRAKRQEQEQARSEPSPAPKTTATDQSPERVIRIQGPDDQQATIRATDAEAEKLLQSLESAARRSR